MHDSFCMHFANCALFALVFRICVSLSLAFTDLLHILPLLFVGLSDGDRVCGRADGEYK